VYHWCTLFINWYVQHAGEEVAVKMSKRVQQLDVAVETKTRVRAWRTAKSRCRQAWTAAYAVAAKGSKLQHFADVAGTLLLMFNSLHAAWNIGRVGSPAAAVQLGR
jgi:hypothetical protein